MVRAVAAVVRCCDAVICTSRNERDELERIGVDRDREKLRVILNGVDPSPLIDEQARKSVRGELGIKPEAVLALFVGQLEQRKAPLLAARAAMQAPDAGAPFLLAVAGDGPQAPQLRALAGERVRVLGYRSDVSRLIAAGDVFVHPSEREGMSLALIEAMSHGLAIVAADSSSNPEAIGDAGLLFKAGDEASLREALLKASEPGVRASLGEKAKARAHELFGPGLFLTQTEAVYRRALADSTKPVDSKRAAARSRSAVVQGDYS
jgi:glycosyltransferase involved in cell wall biosynthesis